MKYKIGYAAAIVWAAIFSLSVTSCTKKKNDGPTPVDSLKVGLLAYYPFNNNAHDESGNGNNGTADSVTPVSDRNGKPNAAYQFDGQFSNISVPDQQKLRLSETDFTLNAWVKIDAYNPSAGSIILSKRITGANNGFTWGIHGNVDGDVGKVTYGPGGGSTNASSATPVALNSWHMVTSVYNYTAGQFTIYIDGVFNSATSGIITTNPNITTLLFIGRDDPSLGTSYFFKGALDEIRIYSRKLSVTDIQKLYTSTN